MIASTPSAAKIIERTRETEDIFTLTLKFVDNEINNAYSFTPGQFNMLYLYGIGEIPISIISNPKHAHGFKHTIRMVGRVTRAMAYLKPGEQIGVRGPFGNGWPIASVINHDLLVVTGGLGCAPVMSAINYAFNRRNQFKRLIIMQGVKHAHDLIWREQYEAWSKQHEVEVYLAADIINRQWHGVEGPVTQLFDKIKISRNTIVFICGPEPMMMVAADNLINKKEVDANNIWLSLERNMECGIGTCGHCQIGDKFTCADGPVFAWPQIADLLKVRNL